MPELIFTISLPLVAVTKFLPSIINVSSKSNADMPTDSVLWLVNLAAIIALSLDLPTLAALLAFSAFATPSTNIFLSLFLLALTGDWVILSPFISWTIDSVSFPLLIIGLIRAGIDSVNVGIFIPLSLKACLIISLSAITFGSVEFNSCVPTTPISIVPFFLFFSSYLWAVQLPVNMNLFPSASLEML